MLDNTIGKSFTLKLKIFCFKSGIPLKIFNNLVYYPLLDILSLKRSCRSTTQLLQKQFGIGFVSSYLSFAVLLLFLAVCSVS